MSTHRGKPYLLGESSTPMDPQTFIMTLAAIQTKLDALTQAMNQTQEKLGRVETHLENRNVRKEESDPNNNEHEEERRSLIPYQRQNEQDHDDQCLKSIKLDVPTFDNRMDPQLFLKWL